MQLCKTLCSRSQAERWRRTLQLPKTHKDLLNALLPSQCESAGKSRTQHAWAAGQHLSVNLQLSILLLKRY